MKTQVGEQPFHVRRVFCAGMWHEGDRVALSREETYHATTVLRLKDGDPIGVFNGLGKAGLGTLRSTSAKRRSAFDVEIIAVTPPQNLSRWTLAFGWPKKAAVEFLVRRGTEIGVRAFWPLSTQWSERATDWPAGGSLVQHPPIAGHRLHKLAIEACKQCELDTVPEFWEPLSFEIWLERQKARHASLFYASEHKRFAPLSDNSKLRGHEHLFLVGPPGGWSAQERAALEKSEFQAVGLGPLALRSETAAVVGLFSLMAFQRALPESQG